MSKPIIEARNLGKRYCVSVGGDRYLSLRDEIAKRLSLSERRARRERREFWALRDACFNVPEGEVFGVIGPNGAGKSTLLKILSRITPPTEGVAVMRGRTASLLEVGTGFHPELTGRENIYLNGAVLGMTRREIARKFDEIVAFAEVERFLDTPVKRYSSGMYVRLGFAVAAHLEPEVLLVDEVLAVGDVSFQARCLGKMGEIARGGRTILFVSHNMSAVSRLCRSAVVLQRGRVCYLGPAEDAVRHYTRTAADLRARIAAHPRVGQEDEGAVGEIAAARLTDAAGAESDTFFLGDRVNLEVDVVFHRPVKFAEVAFVVSSMERGNLYHCVSRDADVESTDLLGPVRFIATFPRIELYPGTYAVSELVLDSIDQTFDHVREVLSFQVVEGGVYVRRPLANQFAAVHEVPEWQVIRQRTSFTESEERHATRGRQ